MHWIQLATHFKRKFNVNEKKPLSSSEFRQPETWSKESYRIMKPKDTHDTQNTIKTMSMEKSFMRYKHKKYEFLKATICYTIQKHTQIQNISVRWNIYSNFMHLRTQMKWVEREMKF